MMQIARTREFFFIVMGESGVSSGGSWSGSTLGYSSMQIVCSLGRLDAPLRRDVDPGLLVLGSSLDGWIGLGEAVVAPRSRPIHSMWWVKYEKANTGTVAMNRCGRDEQRTRK